MDGGKQRRAGLQRSQGFGGVQLFPKREKSSGMMRTEPRKKSEKREQAVFNISLAKLKKTKKKKLKKRNKNLF